MNLRGPNSDDGAIIIEVRGGSVDSAAVHFPTYWLLSERGDSGVTRFVVAGDLTSGPLFTFIVPDIQQYSSFRATVSEVATRKGVVRTTLNGYALTITR